MMATITRYPNVTDGIAYRVFSRNFSSNGDGTGTVSATGDYSVTPLVLKLTPAAGEILYVHKVTVTLSDAAVTFPTRYAGLGAALTNGIASTLYRGDTGVSASLIQANVKRTVDWYRLAGDQSAHVSFSNGDIFTWAIYTAEVFGRPFILDSARLEEWRWTFTDNFTGIDEQQITAFGHTHAWR